MKQILIISLFIALSLHNIYGQNKLSIGKQDFLYKEDNNKIGLPKPKEKRIIFFGNSITQEWSSFTNYFKENNYVNRGISGQTTPQMLLRYNDDVVNLKPYAVIILAGTNDLAGNTGPTTIKEIFELYIHKRKFYMFPILILLIMLIGVTALSQSGLVAFIYPI